MTVLCLATIYIQDCAPAEPGGPWCATFALDFHTNHMLGTLYFTGSEQWAPFNFR